MSCLLQAAGYTGLLLFALRVPVDQTEGGWRWIERALPAIFIILLVVSLTSLGSVFGYPTEFAMRASILAGFVVSVAALAILIGRRKDLSPRDYQRIRWVIWGCLIGLPAYLIAELTQETSLPNSLFGVDAISEDISGLFYLSTGSYACSWWRRCAGRLWSASGSRSAARLRWDCCSACRPTSSMKKWAPSTN